MDCHTPYVVFAFCPKRGIATVCRQVGECKKMEKELKKLNRRELVDIIYQMKKNEQRMQEEITSLEEALDDKRVHISEAGSIADAAVDITQIFSAAQKTADLYLHEISCMKAETEDACAKMIADAEKKAAALLADEKAKLAELKERYQIDYLKWQQLQADLQKPQAQK
jgi:hypothetical protein